MQTNNLRKLMAGMGEEYILNAIYMLRNENSEYYEKIINILIEEYDNSVSPVKEIRIQQRQNN